MQEDWENLETVARLQSPRYVLHPDDREMVRRLLETSEEDAPRLTRLLELREIVGVEDPWDALIRWQEAVSPWCCSPDTETQFVLKSTPPDYRPGISPRLAWFDRCCDSCYRLFFKTLSFARLLGVNGYRAWYLVHDATSLEKSLLEGDEPLRILEAEEVPRSLWAPLVVLLLDGEEDDRRNDPTAGQRRCQIACDIALELYLQAPDAGDSRIRSTIAGWRSGTSSLTLANVTPFPASFEANLLALCSGRLGNAYRYISRVRDARFWMSCARNMVTCYYEVDPVVEAELFSIFGDFNIEAGCLDAAASDIERCEGLYLEHDTHLSAVNKLSKARTERRQNKEPRGYISTLADAKCKIDDRRSPHYAEYAAHNHAFYLIKSGRASEANIAFDQLPQAVDRVTRASRALLRASIDIEIGHFDAALGNGLAARTRYADLGRPYDAALSDLVLGEAFTRLGMSEAAINVLAKACEVFRQRDYDDDFKDALQGLERAIMLENFAEAIRRARYLGDKAGGCLPLTPAPEQSSPNRLARLQRQRQR